MQNYNYEKMQFVFSLESLTSVVHRRAACLAAASLMMLFIQKIVVEQNGEELGDYSFAGGWSAAALLGRALRWFSGIKSCRLDGLRSTAWFGVHNS